MTRRSIMPVLALLFVTVTLPVGHAEGQSDVSIRFDRGTVSADIRQASLSTVLKAIREEKGIWLETGFLKDESLLDERISLKFQDIPVKDGLERILSGINHCLVFEEGGIAGVMLFGKPGKNSSFRQRRTITRPRQPLRRSPTRRR